MRRLKPAVGALPAAASSPSALAWAIPYQRLASRKKLCASLRGNTSAAQTAKLREVNAKRASTMGGATAQPRFAFASNWGQQAMTTIQIELPDATAQAAQAAGLLTPEALEAMLCEQLKKQAVGSLRAMWQRVPQEELTVAQERMIDEAVQAARSESRKRLAS
jgi:hypothetical protein